MARYSLNEVLKQRAQQAAPVQKEDGPVKLDDVTRVKVLSPTRKVFKRFKKNRLAMFGAYLLLTMFLFSFIGPLFYAYSQTQIFYKNDTQYKEYAMVKEMTDYIPLDIDETVEMDQLALLRRNSVIKSMQDEGSSMKFADDGYIYERLNDRLFTISEGQAKLVCKAGIVEAPIGKYASSGKFEPNEGVSVSGLEEAIAKEIKENGKDHSFELNGETYGFTKLDKVTYTIYHVEEGVTYTGEALGSAFEAALSPAMEGEMKMSVGGKDYFLNPVDPDKTQFEVYELVSRGDVFKACTTFSVDMAKPSAVSTELVRLNAVKALVNGKSEFSVDEHFTIEKSEAAPAETEEEGEEPVEEGPVYVVRDAVGNIVPYADYGFTVEERDGELVLLDENGEPVNGEVEVYTIKESEDGFEFYDSSDELFGQMTNFRSVRYTGEDSLQYTLKTQLIAEVKRMGEEGMKESTVHGFIPEQGDDGAVVRDSDGNPKLVEEDLDIIRSETGEYIVKCDQIYHLIDRFGKPTWKHILGTDGDGFDVFARIMYGGRISLLVGFVVVFLEIFLGIIMGGLAGYYGKWVDMLVMRLVDIFYCLPSMPILIIIGAAMDASRLNPYIRLLVMIAALGIMGWAGVARMVRGQILSLREQEFMVAAEATGIKVRSRIFRHLIPNVMPQLIVIATMGMGGVILTESTLSYLGLGVKHPLATWGSMINSVSTATAMKYYPYIWIPVGLLICLTVIAFNFVGDGLRDAYDPKSSR